MEQQLEHWKQLFNPNYLGTYSLPNGQDIVLTIKNIKKEIIIGPGGKKEERPVCYFEENVKPMILNKTNTKMIATLLKPILGDKKYQYYAYWPGYKIQIGSEKVRNPSDGTLIDGLRVKDKLPSEKKIKCEACGEIIVGAFGMDAEELAAYTKKSYGKELCSKCAQKMKEEQK